MPPLPGATGRVTSGWRWQIGAGAVVVLLIRVTGGVVAAGWLIGQRFIRCIVTMHRIRAGLRQARVQTVRGHLPPVVSATPGPEGDLVSVWCVAGTCPADLERARPLLAAACWASEVRVFRHPRHRHLTIVEVLRPESR